MIEQPGIYPAVSAAEYHADPCMTPSVSASLLSTICARSVWHAQWQHPKLAPAPPDREEATRFDLGTAAHALALEGEDRMVLIDAPDWRTMAAKRERDQARAAGKIPLLCQHHTDVCAMVAALKSQVPPPLLTEGRPEVTLIWQEDGLWCRARPDWLRDGCIDDYKTGDDANPEGFARKLFALGFDVQAAWYLRGLKALTGVEAEWRWVVQEVTAPYAVSIVAPGPAVLTLAHHKIEYALTAWRQAVQTGDWPGYGRRTYYATLPAWEEQRWLAKETA